MSDVLKSSYSNPIEYYDALIVVFISFFLITQSIFIQLDSEQHGINYSSVIVLTIVMGLSLIVVILDNIDVDEQWMTYLSVILASFLLGLVQLDVVVSFVLTFGICLRIIKSKKNLKFKLLSFAMISAVFSFFLNYIYLIIEVFTPLSIDINFLFFYITILVIMAIFIILDFSSIRKMIVLSIYEIEVNRERISDQAKVSNNLARFIPDQIWQPIIQDNTPANLFNKRIKLTLFFSDIINFTELSDNLSADALTDILNTYMDRMTLVANRHDAILDKFIGDGMMCFFGAHGYESVRDNALNCVAMAMDMRQEMRVLRNRWQQEGFEGLYVRMGINTGFCHVGNFGTNIRMSYTAIGKEVNLASRLESIAKPDEIIISQSTYELIKDYYICKNIGAHVFKGFEDKVTCWCVIRPINLNRQNTQWFDYELPGFNVHLNVKDVKNYDYKKIKENLNKVIERIEEQEKSDGFKKH